MIPVPFGVTKVDDVLRVVRALGAHRYIAGRAHWVHAFALAALGSASEDGLRDARAWAAGVLADRRIDPASRDEALWRRCSEAELAGVLAAYWRPDEAAQSARAALRALLESHDCVPPGNAPFDESADDTHPILVDAGWELLRLSELDPERHRGGIDAFGDALSFASACFEEDTAIPPPTTLIELPAMGPLELLAGTDDAGALAAPLVVWVEGNELYVDYVLRGVRRAAKLPEP